MAVFFRWRCSCLFRIGSIPQLILRAALSGVRVLILLHITVFPPRTLCPMHGPRRRPAISYARIRPVPIVFEKCWKVTYWNAKKLLKNCQKSKTFLPIILAIFTQTLIKSFFFRSSPWYTNIGQENSLKKKHTQANLFIIKERFLRYCMIVLFLYNWAIFFIILSLFSSFTCVYLCADCVWGLLWNEICINCSFYEMVDFFELDISPKPVFFQKKKKQFSQKCKTCSRLLVGRQKVLKRQKLLKSWGSTIRTGLVHGVVYCGYSVTHLLSSSCCYNQERMSIILRLFVTNTNYNTSFNFPIWNYNGFTLRFTIILHLSDYTVSIEHNVVHGYHAL